MSLLFLVLGMGLGCMENDETIPQPALEPPAVANFETISEEIAFDKAHHEVTIFLDKILPSTSDITLRVTGSALYSQNFTTNPAIEFGLIKLTVAKGSQFAKFTISRIEDQSEEHKTVIINIHEDESDIQPGVQSSTTLVLKKKEVTEVPKPAQISFVETQGSIQEGQNDGLTVLIQLSQNVPHTIPFGIQISSPDGFLYGTHFTTEPKAVLGELTMHVVPGISSYSFRVVPYNDNMILGSYSVSFTLSSTNEDIQTGSKDTFTVLIEEDEPLEVNLQTLSDLRNKFTEHDGNFWIPEDYYIEGVVTSGLNVSDKRIAYIQDNSAAIMLRFIADNTLKMGDKVRLNLKGATGQIINGQKAIVDVADRSGVKLAENISVSAKTITVEQFLSRAFDGQKIRLEGVRFDAADGFNTFSENNIIIASNSRLVLKVYTMADFRGKTIPQGNLSVTGIIGDWGNLQPQDFNHDFLP